MDNAKYKSVAVPNQVHKVLKHLAHLEGRTMGGKMSHIVREYNAAVRGRGIEYVHTGGNTEAFGKHLERIKTVDSTVSSD